MMTLLRSLLILTFLLVNGANAGERISVLTLNVAGLPDFLTSQDNPEMRMVHIAARAEKWDVVAYQEDFYYSRWLDLSQAFDTTIRGNKMHKWSMMWPWLRKSGLTIKTNLVPWSRDFTAYSECFGHKNYGSDCWVPKGVLCMRTLTPGGVLMDFCTTHMDAGNDPGSTAARQTQIDEFLTSFPPPVLDVPWLRVEAGDYNLRTYQEDIVPLLEGREVIVYNTGEGNNVDYITVTTNDHLSVRVIEGGVVPMFDGLSDHPGIGAILYLEY
jgi:hypothetical protein